MSGTQVFAGIPPPITPAMLLAGTDAVARPITAVTLANAISQATGGPTLIFVQQASDFGTPVEGVYTLEADTAYFILGTVDLTGDRLVAGSDTALIGVSSEVSILKSTGLAGALIASVATDSLILRDLTVTADLALDIDGGGTMACDWHGVNFTGCAEVGTVANVANFVYSKGAFLGSANMEFDGTIGTVAFSESLFTGLAGQTAFNFPATLTITRRIRYIYSSFICPATSTGITLNASATVPVEAYILDTCNFSGSGTKTSGVVYSDNKSLWVNCVGINNTAVNGQLYMQNNATATVLADTTTFVKVAGTTTASADNERYTMPANNRLTNAATINRKFLVVCTLSFTTTAGNVCEFGFYDSELAAVRTPSRTLATANAAGRAESVTFHCIVNHESGNYVEVHARNTSAANNVTVSDMNLTVTQLGS